MRKLLTLILMLNAACAFGQTKLSVDDGTGLKTIIKSRLLTSGSNTLYFLKSDGATIATYSPVSSSQGFATGDMLYAAATNPNFLTRRAIGSTGDVLTVSGGLPVWAAPSTSGLVTTFSAGTTGLTPNSATSGAITLGGVLIPANGGTGLSGLPTNGQLLIGNNASGYTIANLTAGSGISVTDASGGITIANTAPGFLNPMTTVGDMIFENATPAPARLAATTNGYILTLVSGLPVWAANAGGSGTVGWLLTGNSGTTYGTNFIGTTDAQSLQFRVNSQPSGTIEIAGSGENTGIGYQSLLANVSGVDNVAGGYHALYANTGDRNAAIGHSALDANTTGSSNTAIGYLALHTNTTGGTNTAIGRGADVATSALSNAMALGYNASVAASNSIQFGNGSVTLINTSGLVQTTGGINLSGASAPFEVGGSAGTSGYVLTSAGTATTPTWSSLGSIGSGSFILNGTSAQSGANFNITGSGSTTEAQIATTYTGGTATALVLVSNNTNAAHTNQCLTLSTGGGGAANWDVVGTSASWKVSNAGDATFNHATLTNALPIASGGTGGTTQFDAFQYILTPQTGNAGKFLTTDGTSPSWATAGTGTVTSVNVALGGMTSSGAVTTSGTVTMSGSLNVASGGTGAATLTGILYGNGTSAITGSHSVNLSTEVSGGLPIGNGGTGSTLGTISGYAGNASNLGANNTAYFTPNGTSMGGVTQNQSVEVLADNAETISMLYVSCPAPGPGQTTVFTLMKNGTAQSVTVTVSGFSTTGLDITNSFTTIAGDRLSIRIVTSTTSGSNMASWGFRRSQ